MIGMYKTKALQTGFSLIEMMVVIAIISIIALMAMPNTSNRVVQTQVVESIELVEDYKEFVEKSFLLNGEFPLDNEAAGMPNAVHIRGNYLSALHVKNGVLNLELGQKMREIHRGKIVSIRPVYVAEDLTVRPSWVCAGDEIPDGMQAAGADETNIEVKYLPIRCR